MNKFRYFEPPESGIREYNYDRKYFAKPEDPLFSDENEEIMSIISSVLNQALSEGITDEAEAVVVFIYDKEGPNHKGTITKPMNAFQIKNLDEFKDLYRKFTDLHLAPNEDYIYEIIGIQVKIVKTPSGGCNPKHEKIEKIGKGTKRINPRSSNNNCFFGCLEKLIPGFKAHIRPCNEIRSQYGLFPNSPIPIDIAWLIIQSCNLDVGLLCFEPVIEYNPDALTCIQLVDGHYTLVETKHLKTCKQCRRKYSGVT